MSEKKRQVVDALKCCIMRDPDDVLRCTQCSYRFPFDANCLNRLKMDALEVLTEVDADAISRTALLAAYDAAHQGPPGGARKLIEEAPAIAEQDAGQDYCEIEV